MKKDENHDYENDERTYDECKLLLYGLSCEYYLIVVRIMYLNRLERTGVVMASVFFIAENSRNSGSCRIAYLAGVTENTSQSPNL